MSGSQIETWCFMSSFWYPISISAIYTMTVSYLYKTEGQWYRIEEYQFIMDRIVGIISAVIAALHVYLAFFFSGVIIGLEYNLLCEPPYRSVTQQKAYDRESYRSSRRHFWWFNWMVGFDADSESKLAVMEISIAAAMWWYLIAKIFDLFPQLLNALTNHRVHPTDSIHHGIMVVLAWIGIKFLPGGSTVIWMAINSIYLGLANSSYSIRKLFTNHQGSDQPWKSINNLLSWLKLAHFFFAGLHCVTVLFASSKCGYPKLAASVLLSSILLFLSIALPKFLDRGGPPPPPAFPGEGPDTTHSSYEVSGDEDNGSDVNVGDHSDGDDDDDDDDDNHHHYNLRQRANIPVNGPGFRANEPNFILGNPFP